MIKQVRALTGILFLCILAYAGIWYTAAFQAEKDVTALLASWRDRGMQVEHGKIDHGGFPYRITVNIKDLSIATRARGLSVEAKNLLLISHVWTPQHWMAETTGLAVSLVDGSTLATSDTMLASYRVHDDGKAIVAFENTSTNGFSLNRLLGKPATTPENWKLFLRFGGDATQQSGLYAERFLAFKLEAQTGTNSLSLGGGISGPAPTDWTTQQLANWSNEGGLLEIDAATLRSGNSFLKGNASLTIDEKYKLLGSASLTIANGSTIAELLKGYGIPLENTLPEKGPISLSLQNGVASIDGAPITQLKSLLD